MQTYNDDLNELTEFLSITNLSVGKVDSAKRKTRNVMSKYERAKIIGVRAQQIALDVNHLFVQKPSIESFGKKPSPIDLAILELQQAKTPLIIRRYIKKDKSEYEDWKVSELVQLE